MLLDVYEKSPTIVSRAIAGEYLLVPICGKTADLNCIYSLNALGAFIWDHIDGRRTVADIVESVVRDYDVTREDAERDVIEYVAALREVGAIVLRSPETER
jgi:hypothetical protein